MSRDAPKTSQFYAHRDKIEQGIARSILVFGEKTKLRDACEYVLKGGGKRFRPLLVLLIAEALGNSLPVLDAALAVEFFHAASLIVDDLPCMDNEEERRSLPTLHNVYGESVALLSSYALICAAFEKIHANAVMMRRAPSPFRERADSVGLLVLEHATRCAGIHGATGGQFFDLFPPTLNIETIRQIIYRKTIALFEVSFISGWLFGGGDIGQLDLVRRCASHFGMAFQVADDLGDIIQDEKNQREINLARHIGRERALLVFEEELKGLTSSLAELGLETPSFQKMCSMLQQLAAQNSPALR